MTKEFDKRNAAKSRRVCEAMDRENGRRKLSDRERRILDMWPRFEDGEPVMAGDEATINENRRFTVKRIEFRNGKWMLNDSRTEGHYLHGKSCERVERPAPKVLDADGVEIRVGDTVWFKGNPRPYAVVEVKNGIVRLYSKTHCSEESATSVFTDILTHIAPDSWERLEEDACNSICGYFGKGVSECDDCPANAIAANSDEFECCERAVKLDIVRRAKALAGVEVDS